MFKSSQSISQGYEPFKESVIDPWRSKIETVGRRKVLMNRKEKKLLFGLVFLLIMTFSIFLLHTQTESHDLEIESKYMPSESKLHTDCKNYVYNSTYPFSKPRHTKYGIEYRFGVITDMDEESKVADKKNTWKSFLRVASLHYNPTTEKATITWFNTDDNPISLLSRFSNGGRGMELSELLVFNGHLYTIDDRTGIVYQIEDENKIFPWVVLSDGNGHEIKGFKGEWMIKKGENMVIGGIGKVWTTPSGQVLHHNPQFVKIIDPNGKIVHKNWTEIYMKMQEVAGFPDPGYIIHESGAWSDVHNSWFFLPRRASTEQYNDIVDEERGTNLLFKCSENFEVVQYEHIGDLTDRKRGFSSFKFIPGLNDEVIIALKTHEYKGTTKSFITVFKINGKILLPDTIISETHKYEGLEFL